MIGLAILTFGLIITLVGIYIYTSIKRQILEEEVDRNEKRLRENQERLVSLERTSVVNSKIINLSKNKTKKASDSTIIIFDSDTSHLGGYSAGYDSPSDSGSSFSGFGSGGSFGGGGASGSWSDSSDSSSDSSSSDSGGGDD